MTITSSTQDLIEAITTQYPDQPLEQLTAAVLNAEALASTGDALVSHFVDQARASGSSWQAIGASLGVTKQAAQKRFTPKQSQNMFALFTDQARQVILQAQEEAHAARLGQISAAHLLLGLLDIPDCLAGDALQAQGLQLAELRTSVVHALPMGAPQDHSPVMIPFDEGARRVLESSVAQAQRLESAVVSSAHVLLALVDELGSSLLAGVDAQALEQFVQSSDQAR